MAIYELRETVLRAVPETTFSEQGVYERRDIQRVLRENIKVLGESLLVIAEEFGEWIDSNRRIDLLCLDTDANLVVVELKRTDDGGHMELQAIRYAAMVSKMTFDKRSEDVVEIVVTKGRSAEPMLIAGALGEKVSHFIKES